MELPITRLERVDDQHTTTEVSGQDEIAETFLDHWRRLFNLPALAPSAETDARDILAVIRDDPARQLAPEMAARLDVAALISVGSIEAAIDAMKTDTAPGADGFPPRFYKDRRWRRRLAERLHRLYAQIVRDGEMSLIVRTTASKAASRHLMRRTATATVHPLHIHRIRRIHRAFTAHSPHAHTFSHIQCVFPRILHR